MRSGLNAKASRQRKLNFEGGHRGPNSDNPISTVTYYHRRPRGRGRTLLGVTACHCPPHHVTIIPSNRRRSALRYLHRFCCTQTRSSNRAARTDARPDPAGGRQPRRRLRRRPGGVAASAFAQKSRRDMLNLSLSGHDPDRTLPGAGDCVAGLIQPSRAPRRKPTLLLKVRTGRSGRAILHR